MGLNVVELDRLKGNLREAIKALRNIDEFLEIEAEALAGMIDDAYETGISPSGKAFPAYPRPKPGSKPKPKKQLLIKTGLSRRTSIAVADEGVIKVGIGTPYAKFFAQVTEKYRSQPRRNPLPFDTEESFYETGPAGEWAEGLPARFNAWFKSKLRAT